MRNFFFGCSLTQYFWPTWADILIKHFESSANGTGYNWGKSGAGNQFIFTKIWEANSLYHFTEQDRIFVQWTSMFREDRYHEDNGWYCPGGFNHERFSPEPMKLNGFEYEDELQWADFLHCAMRDCALISSTRHALANIGCEVHFTGFRNFNEGYENYLELPNSKILLVYENLGAILEQYKEEIRLDLPPILTALDFGIDNKFFKTRPRSVPKLGEAYKQHLLHEIHPLPNEQMKYVKDFVLDTIGESSLHPEAEKLVEQYQKLIDKEDPIILENLKWANTYQMGFSDDGWRP